MQDHELALCCWTTSKWYSYHVRDALNCADGHHPLVPCCKQTPAYIDVLFLPAHSVLTVPDSKRSAVATQP